MLSDNIDQLHVLAGALIELETLSGDEIKRVLAGERVDRNDLRTTTTAPVAPGLSAIPKSGRRGGTDPVPAPQG